jgi:glycosyltransferase involved in cell wall biosynthesis
VNAGGRPAVAIVVPAYNEERNLPRLFGELEESAQQWGLSPRIVVVDDGSSDGTAVLVSSYHGPLRVDLVSQGRNQGVAAALEAGIRRALDDPALEYVGLIEADTTSDLGAFPRLLAAVESGADIAQGSVRVGPGHMEGVSRLRVVVSWGANTLLRLASGAELATISNLYRVIRADTLRSALARNGRLVREPGFAGVSELVLNLRRAGAHVVEVPVVLHAEKRADHSRINFSGTTLAYLRVAARALLARRPPLT